MHGYKTRLEELHTKTILRAIFSQHPKASNLDPNSIQEVLECLDLDVQQALAAALKDPKPPLTDSEFADLVGDDEDDPEDLRDAADIEEDRKKEEEQD